MSVAAFTGAPTARVPRVRPVPALEPPYDPFDDGDRPRLTVVTTPAEPLPFADLAPRKTTLGQQFWGPQPTRRRDLPDPRPLARRFLQAAVEALAGRRSGAQLQEWTSPAVFADLNRALRVRRPVAPAAIPTVLSVHLDEPADGVAEVCAVVRYGPRCRAVAARLEGVDGRWRCVALQVG